MLALPLALLPLTVALHLIATAQPRVDRSNPQLCAELQHELGHSVIAGLLTEEEAEIIHQRCLRDFT